MSGERHRGGRAFQISGKPIAAALAGKGKAADK